MTDTPPTHRRAPWQVDAVLIADPVFNADGRLHAWGRLPDTTWRDLAPLLSERYDRIGFSAYPADDAFIDGGIARALDIESCEPMPDTEVDGERYDLCVCDFSAYTAYLLGQTGFNHWHSTDPDLHSDEVCFLKDGRVELLAQPWRSMLRFFAVEHPLLQRVEAANVRYRGSVFVLEHGRFRGI